MDEFRNKRLEEFVWEFLRLEESRAGWNEQAHPLVAEPVGRMNGRLLDCYRRTTNVEDDDPLELCEWI